MKVIRLREGKERSLLRRHPWVFAGSVEKGKADLGETVRVESHDGRFLAAASMNGSNSPPTSRLFNDFGILTVFRRAGRSLTPVTQTRIGHWCEGIAWNAKGDTLLVQCAEEELQVFRFNGRRLTRAGSLKVHGVPSGIGTAR